MPTTLKAHLRETFAGNSEIYARDLAAMSHDQLNASPGGGARSGYDFTYEVVLIHRRIVARLAGHDPGPYAGANGWVVAPNEFRSPEIAIKEIRDSSQEVLDAFDAVAEEELEREILLPQGKSSPLAMMSLAISHLNYHDAQLNYIQQLHGDMAMHWQD